MDKTFTFDNNIRSFDRYKINNSVITVIGEIHDANDESNITKYIQNINNTDDTLVFLELDTKSVNDEIYMKGIQSSTIKDVIKKFRKDRIYYFDNRNEFLGGEGHFQLYYGDVNKLNMNWYIDKYQQYYKDIPENVKSRHEILNENIEKYNRLYTNFINNPNDNREQKINNLEQFREPLVKSFREFWANVVDENLIEMILRINESKPDAKFEFIVIVGLQHARYLNHRFTEMNLHHLSSNYTENDNNIQINYRVDTFWDDPKMDLMNLP